MANGSKNFGDLARAIQQQAQFVQHKRLLHYQRGLLLARLPKYLPARSI